MRSIVSIYPPELLQLPEIQAAIREGRISNPVSIEHSLIACSRCGQQGWIGPKQRQFAEERGSEILCIVPCLAGDQRAMEAVQRGNIASLNPDIENVPRRT